MIIGVSVLYRISYSVVSNLYERLSILITSFGEVRADFFCYRLLVIMSVVYFEEASSSSCCL